MPNCECCNIPMIEKTEEDLLVTLRKWDIKDVSKMTMQAFKSFRYVYDCHCPENIEKLERYKKAQLYKQNQEEK